MDMDKFVRSLQMMYIEKYYISLLLINISYYKSFNIYMTVFLLVFNRNKAILNANSGCCIFYAIYLYIFLFSFKFPFSFLLIYKSKK